VPTVVEDAGERQPAAEVGGVDELLHQQVGVATQREPQPLDRREVQARNVHAACGATVHGAYGTGARTRRTYSSLPGASCPAALRLGYVHGTVQRPREVRVSTARCLHTARGTCPRREASSDSRSAACRQAMPPASQPACSRPVVPLGRSVGSSVSRSWAQGGCLPQKYLARGIGHAASHRVLRSQPKASGRKGSGQEQGAGHSAA
jgi:hypothetical protein